jgi:hypothetical protein
MHETRYTNGASILDKAHILAEINRTADANGGKPLGWRKFLSETGIKQSDWFTESSLIGATHQAADV